MADFVPISVVIPIHGHLNYISRAIDSIASQTLLPFEVIVVNDGGDVRMIHLLKTICDKYDPNWIRIINLPENHGAAYARNIGWDQSHGDYVAFLDADDAWHPEKIQIQYRFMKDNPSVDYSGHLHCVEKASPIWANYTIQNVAVSIIKLKILLFNPFITPSVMLKRGIPIRFNSKQRFSEDYQLWITLALSNYKGVKLKSELACIYKPSLSKNGLSSQLWKMECGELLSYVGIYKFGWQYFPVILMLVPFSLLKFARRVFIFALLR